VPGVVRLETDTGDVVCERCAVADRALSRMRGLLGRSSLEPGEGLLIRPAGSIHTFFMRFPIDVVFCDRELRVLGVAPEVGPWKARMQRRARVAVELPAGEAARRGVTPGVQLRTVPV
jgi:uncharacterized protein